ncbi:MAG: hypothetical protein ACLP1X_05430 [Polyangiaceae bacterium]|jgi:hypothetical protein
MRVVLASVLLVLLGCGAAQKPAEGSTGDTAALEPSSSPAADTSPGPAASSDTSDSKPATSHAGAAPAASSDAPAAAAPSAFHPTPSATGSIDGKPFTPKLARVSGALQKDGRIPITLTEHTDCDTPATSKPGEGSMTLVIEWKDGYKTDLGSLKRTGKKEVGFTRVSAAGAAGPSKTFKPTGKVTIVSAPMDQGATGKMKIDLQSGDYMLAGDLDVQVCVAPK